MKSLTLSIVTIMLHLVGKAYAATDGGICGTDCNWVFDTETKTLTITTE